MTVTAVIISTLLAAILAASAEGKLKRRAHQVKVMQTTGVPLDRMWLLASAELAGAVGLIAGLRFWPLGAAAAIGLVLYFVGAVGAHVRVRDRDSTAAAVLLTASVAATIAIFVAH